MFFQLAKPFSHKPMFRFGTIPWSHTDSTLKKYFKDMHAYMQQFNRSNVIEGVGAVTNGYVVVLITNHQNNFIMNS